MKRAAVKIFNPLDIDTEKFYSFVGPPNERGCREWTGARVKQGYGRFPLNKHLELRANRVALSLKLGEVLTETDMACHTCDNPPCCTEEHLFKGTCKENLNDAVEKGRLVFSGRSNWELCPRGHELIEGNIYWYKPHKEGKPKRRQCRKCTLDRQKVADSVRR